MVFAAEASNPITAVIVAAVLFGISRPIIIRVAGAEAKPWLVSILTASLILHLLCAPAQIFVVDHFYHGVADWVRYDSEGARLAPGFRHFNFSLAPGDLRGIVNDGSVSIAAGVVFTIVGTNQLAAFMVFAWFAFLGGILFFRAFTLTFSGAGARRYAYLIFFLPSLLFWTADVSKEAIMTLSLGLLAYGAAKILARRPGGYTLALLGVAVGILIRPNELLLIVAGFTVALMVSSSGTHGSEGARRLVRLFFFGSVLVLSTYLTLHYLHHPGGSLSLQNVQSANVGNGGSGGVPYSTNLATFPRDVYEVLWNPLPFNFHGFGELIAACENSVILILVLASLRNLRMVPRAVFSRAYVMMCTVYSLGFFYTFAALGNLGLITRERTLLFPFLMVLLCIPRSPKRQPPRFEWEVRRRDRERIRAAQRAAQRAATLAAAARPGLRGSMPPNSEVGPR
jgi:hypothetical protein